MKVQRTEIDAVLLVTHDPLADERGVFAELFNSRAFADGGIAFRVDQVNISMSLRAGTVRGMHWQAMPDSQVKLVRCTSGEVWDVVVDVRPESPTYLKHAAFRLRAGDRTSVYVPRMCAHGWQALKDGSEITYLVEGLWNRGAECGLRPDDPFTAIRWPLPPVHLNKRDAEWPILGKGTKSRDPAV